jgi:histidyl-tRNA synthetase
VAFDEPAQRAAAFATVVEARRAGISAQLELAGRSLKGQLKQAGRVGAGFVAILRAGGMELRDSQTGAQEPVDGPTAVVARVLRDRHGMGSGL